LASVWLQHYAIRRSGEGQLGATIADDTGAEMIGVEFERASVNVGLCRNLSDVL
jgi:hypothetical protein